MFLSIKDQTMFLNGGLSDAGKQFFFRQPFSERYILTIKTDALAGSIPIKTVTEIRWDLRVLNVTEEGTEIELITLDNELLETNNPALKELARMNQLFARMYSELHVLIDRSGKVREILNEELIRRKWASVKREMEEMENQVAAVKGIILMNDELFTSPDKMKEAVQGNEFFGIYFNHVYGMRLPGESRTEGKWNLFQQARVEWRYDVKPGVPLPAAPQVSSVEVDITGRLLTRLDKEWINLAYGAFQNIDLSGLKPRLTELGKYRLDPHTGRLKEAYLLKEEVADPRFVFSKIEYFMKSQEIWAQK